MLELSVCYVAEECLAILADHYDWLNYVWSGPVCNKYSYIQIIMDIYVWVYLFAQICIELFQWKYILYSFVIDLFQQIF